MDHWLQMAGALPYFAVYWTLDALSRIDMFDVIGMAGTTLLIISFTLLQMGKVQTGVKYSTLNLCAALLLAVSLTRHFNLASMVIEVFWVAMSIYGIVKGLREEKQKRLALLPKHFMPSPPQAIHMPVMEPVPEDGRLPSKMVMNCPFVIKEEGEPLDQIPYWSVCTWYRSPHKVQHNGFVWECTSAQGIVGDEPHVHSRHWYSPEAVLANNAIAAG